SPKVSNGAAIAPANIASAKTWIIFMWRHSGASVGVDVDHRLGKRRWRFLGQIVSDPALDKAVSISARKPLRIRSGVGVGRTIGIAFESNRGNRDDREFGQSLVEGFVLRFAFGECKPPPVVVDHDADVIRIVEGRGTAIERGVVELPLRRPELPDELRKVVAVLVVDDAGALRGEIDLRPPLELRCRRQRHLAGFLAADQVSAHGYHGFATFRPKRRDDVGRARTPIESGERRLLYLERVHE